MENNAYAGTIIYGIERIKRILFFEVRQYDEIVVEYPHLILTTGEEIAKNLIKYSSFWKDNVMPNVDKSKIEILQKEVFIEEIKDETMLYYLYAMKPKDFFDYMKQIQEKV
jgi:hypothetical protein